MAAAGGNGRDRAQAQAEPARPWPATAPGDGAAQLFRVLGHPVRLRVLWLLAHKEEFGLEDNPCCDGDVVCVCRIKALFDISAPDLSHHLRVLREAGLVETRRVGIWTHYSLCPTALQPVLGILSEFEVERKAPTS